MSRSHSFYNLEPNLILSCAEKNGYRVTGELIQLNSYENRVFDIKIESGDSIIGKFYRPGRWSRDSIADEHRFIRELRSEGIEVADVFSLRSVQDQNKTVGDINGIYFSFFEKVRGRLVQELTLNHYKKIGRWLARLHNIGQLNFAEHRSTIGPANDQRWQQLDLLLERVAPEVVRRYENAAVKIFEDLDSELEKFNFIRLHGDLHRGNILEGSTGDFVVVDFDDMINGPEVQDMWMLMPNADLDSEEFETLIHAYSELREFPYEQLSLIPLLRGYRIITYAMWIMNRWDDPSFPRLFPDFGGYAYWAEETESLEKISHSRDR